MISLSIQEIINDFENIITAYDKNHKEHFKEVEEMCGKYIPAYYSLTPPTYYDGNKKEKNQILLDMTYKKIKEILMGLV